MKKIKNTYVKCLLYGLCFTFVLLHSIPSAAQSDCMLSIPFEKNSNYSADYSEVLSFFYNAGQCADFMDFKAFGDSDAGKPLSVLIVDKKAVFEPIAKDKRTVILINNAIHPGEPCGIEASMLLVKDMIEKDEFKEVLDDVILLIIPVYNIGGMLNRGSFSRANQNGPEEYGFRGNAKNLDLNRDFIKSDSRNAKSLHQLFNRWKPDIFIDTHTSNGADYTYTMTLIANMQDRLAPSLRTLIYDDMLPLVYDEMANSGWEMVPYVNAPTTPDEGIEAFNDLPRYSMGYGALHHIPSFTTEAHMLKPYADRVAATRSYFDIMINYCAANGKQIQKARIAAVAYYNEQTRLPIAWEIKKDTADELIFKGYEAKQKLSEVTGKDRLYYDRSQTFEKVIPFWQRYKASIDVEVPTMYVLPQAYSELAEKLRQNGVELLRSRRDSSSTSKSYRITKFETKKTAYEGHYLHFNVEVEASVEDYQVRSGDYMIASNQAACRFIVETLEPQAPDSYFAWNFFDGILMQKEYFSPYVFEETAARLLKSDASLKRKFDEKKAIDPAFAENWFAQLRFIYEASLHYEKTHNVYPVGRLFD